MIHEIGRKMELRFYRVELKIAVNLREQIFTPWLDKVGAGNGLGMSSDGGAPRVRRVRLRMRQTSTRIILGDATDLDVAKPLGRRRKRIEVEN